MSAAVIRQPVARSRRAAVAGVASGLAHHLDIPVSAMRVTFVALTAAGGSGALLYLWVWAFAPLEPQSPDAAPGVRRSVPVAAILAAIALTFTVVVVTGAHQRLYPLPPTSPLLTAGVAGISAVVWSLTFDRADSRLGARYGRTVRMLAAAAMLLTTVGTFTNRVGPPSIVIAVALAVLAIAALAAPTVVRLWTDLLAERATRVRQEHRAEIAAHLHDSVLQTLALIQNRAGASSEVARIARAQERELRDWLFVGDAPAAGDLLTELRSVAAAVELDYPVRIDVVTVGETDAASPALVGASREAMVNAARHAGGEVSVYVECARGAVDVWVRDRGPGVDLDALPSDRLGIRESIIGRMTRAGGTATVRRGVTGSGAEVHLHLEVAP